jgi:hypothetical protein
VIACVVLTAIFWGNLLRFSPRLIDHVFDTTSEASVVGRLARAAADGVFKNTDLGSNADREHPNTTADPDNYDKQIRYYEHPELIHSLDLTWAPYPSHFAMQGYVFAIIDVITPLPRNMRISFFHLLASLFTAAVLVWMASILGERFGWAAFFGFLFPVAIEPMFSAIAPNLCWFMGSWLLPIPFGMLLADEDNPRRRTVLLGLMFLAFLFRFLSGYEFVPTIILATAVGCILTTKGKPDLFARVFRNACLTICAGLAAFVSAATMHAAKQGGFAVFLQKAASRTSGDAGPLDYQLVYGKFQPIGAVIWLYLGNNYITLIRSFGFLLTLLALYAVLALLDERFNWFYGAGRRRLQVLALAVLASFTAPLSWFILGKGHSFDHLPYDLAMWYVPTIPLGFAMLAVGTVSFKDYLALRRGDALRSWLVASVPVLIVGAAIAIRLVDKKTETRGTWAITEHANAAPIFESGSLGLEFRMTNDWFTVVYRCSDASQDRLFEIEAEQDGKTVNYSFEVYRNQVLASGNQCVGAQAKSDRPIGRIHFGERGSKGPIWQRDATISMPDTFTPEPLTNGGWDRGVSRDSPPRLLLSDSDFGHLLIKKGDQLQISSSDRRTITSISSDSGSTALKLDGAPIHLDDGAPAVFGIMRK